jgi:hypothetical protein
MLVRPLKHMTIGIRLQTFYTNGYWLQKYYIGNYQISSNSIEHEWVDI